jgi:hypothetical protein
VGTLTVEHVQDLLDQSRGPGLLLSCYADVSVAEGFKSHWRGHFKTAAREIRESLAGDHQARLEFDRNLEAVHRALEESREAHARGLAVFAADQRGFLRSFPLRSPIENQLIIHDLPYVVPLLEVLLQMREYLVVLADTHRGQLLSAASDGTIRVLATLDEAVPPRERSAHRDYQILHFQKELLEAIEKSWAAQPFDGILLLGEHETVEHLRNRLSSRLSDHVVHVAGCDWLDAPVDVGRELQKLLGDLHGKAEASVRGELQARAAQRRAVALGRAEVLDALQSGKVSPKGHGRLILGKDPKEAVARCTSCRWLSLDAQATCQRCQAACVQGSLWEELLFFALRHDLSVSFLQGDEVLERNGGAAVLLTG